MADSIYRIFQDDFRKLNEPIVGIVLGTDSIVVQFQRWQLIYCTPTVQLIDFFFGDDDHHGAVHRDFVEKSGGDCLRFSNNVARNFNINTDAYLRMPSSSWVLLQQAYQRHCVPLKHQLDLKVGYMHRDGVVRTRAEAKALDMAAKLAALKIAVSNIGGAIGAVCAINQGKSGAEILRDARLYQAVFDFLPAVAATRGSFAVNVMGPTPRVPGKISRLPHPKTSPGPALRNTPASFRNIKVTGRKVMIGRRQFQGHIAGKTKVVVEQSSNAAIIAKTEQVLDFLEARLGPP